MEETTPFSTILATLPATRRSGRLGVVNRWLFSPCGTILAALSGSLFAVLIAVVLRTHTNQIGKELCINGFVVDLLLFKYLCAVIKISAQTIIAPIKKVYFRNVLKILELLFNNNDIYIYYIKIIILYLVYD